MAGTHEGGLKAAASNKAKFGDNFYGRIGSMGGSASHYGLKGFAANPELARIAGKKGGAKSRRRPAK